MLTKILRRSLSSFSLRKSILSSLKGFKPTISILPKHSFSSIIKIPASKTVLPFSSQKTTQRGASRKPLDIKVGQVIQNHFKVNGITHLPFYNITLYELRHLQLGTRYIHLDSPDLQNSFAVLFRSPPTNSKGVTHIIEHSVLCGSKKYPIRDPFMNMLKRSLNTYMNAWTGSDFTMYPFSTQNQTDYYNLMSVYLDAVFAPRLRKLDFMQEGHRLQINSEENGLIRKGVVLNQMKGVMSSPDNFILQHLQNTLFESGPYHYNQGGDPADIPKLTYEEYLSQYKKFYHIKNATFLSYGDLDFREHLKFISDNYINNAQARKDNQTLNPNSNFIPQSTQIKKSKENQSPRNVQIPIQPELTRPIQEQGKYCVGFILRDIKQQAQDGYENFKLYLVSKLLTDGPSSPFYKALIESELAPTFGPGVGFDNTTRQSTFTISVDGVPVQSQLQYGKRKSKKNQEGNVSKEEAQFNASKKLEQVIRHTLRDVAKNGFDKEQVESAIHQMNLQIRQQGEQYGLKVISALIPYILHSQSNDQVIKGITNPFKVKQYCERLRAQPQNVLKQIVQKYFVENTNCVKIAFIPDEGLADRQAKKQKKELDDKFSKMSADDKSKLIEQAKQLQESQNQQDDVSVLPTLTTQDIPQSIQRTILQRFTIQGYQSIPAFYCQQSTNGILYLRIKCDLKSMPNTLSPFVPFFVQILNRIGTQSHKHSDFYNKMHGCSSGVSATIDSFIDQNGQEQHNILMECSFMEEKLVDAFGHLSQLLSSPNFHDFTNLSQLIKQISVNKANNIGQEGLKYALSYGSGLLSGCSQRYQSLQSDIFITELGAEVLKTTDPKQIFNDIAGACFEISRRLLTQENIAFAVHGNQQYKRRVAEYLQVLLTSIKSKNKIFSDKLKDEKQGQQSVNFPSISPQNPKIFFKTPLTINHCSETMIVPYYSSKTHAHLKLLGSLLTTNFLHPMIRQKGGAYGAGCAVNQSGLLSFYSYFDPNVDKTYNSFQRSITQIAQNASSFNQIDLEQAKLLTFQRVDRVQPPSKKGLLQFARGYDPIKRQQFRQNILKARVRDMQQVAQEQVLDQMINGKTARVVVGSQNSVGSSVMQQDKGWKFYNPMEFLSKKYFEKYDDGVSKNQQ